MIHAGTLSAGEPSESVLGVWDAFGATPAHLCNHAITVNKICIDVRRISFPILRLFHGSGVVKVLLSIV